MLLGDFAHLLLFLLISLFLLLQIILQPDLYLILVFDILIAHLVNMGFLQVVTHVLGVGELPALCQLILQIFTFFLSLHNFGTIAGTCKPLLLQIAFQFLNCFFLVLYFFSELFELLHEPQINFKFIGVIFVGHDFEKVHFFIVKVHIKCFHLILLIFHLIFKNFLHSLEFANALCILLYYILQIVTFEGGVSHIFRVIVAKGWSFLDIHSSANQFYFIIEPEQVIA